MSCCSCGPTPEWLVNTGGTLINGTLHNPNSTGGTAVNLSLVNVQLGIDCNGNPVMSGSALARCSDIPTIPPAQVIPTTLPPSGPAGGDLTGTYPNPSFRPGAPVLKSCGNLTIGVGDTVVTCADLTASITDVQNDLTAYVDAQNAAQDAIIAVQNATQDAAIAAKQGQLLDAESVALPSGAEVLSVAGALAATAAPNNTQVAVATAVSNALCVAFSGVVADPRPNVNPGMRVLGIDTGSPDCTDAKFEVSTYADTTGVGVAATGRQPQKLMSVDTIVPWTRFDPTNTIYGVGLDAAKNATGTTVHAFGMHAATDNTGSDIVAVGNSTAYWNVGSHNTFVGGTSGIFNTGDYNNYFGQFSGRNNTGSSNTGAGYFVQAFNTGDIVSSVGHVAAGYNQGDYVAALGYFSALSNIGTSVVAVGVGAGAGNSGGDVVLIGHDAGAYNQSNNVDAVGYFAGNGPFITLETVDVTYASANTVTINPPTAAAVGSVVNLNAVGLSGIAGVEFANTPFTVTTPTLLTMLVGAGGQHPSRVFAPGSITGVPLLQTPLWSNNSYFGQTAVGSGPNQAVLGGPGQTPCGWAPFTNISDKRDKKETGTKVPASVSLDFVTSLSPVGFVYDHRERYTKVERVEVLETKEEFKARKESLLRARAQDRAAGMVDVPPDSDISAMKPEVRRKVLAERVEQDGSRADAHEHWGFFAQDVLSAAEKAGVPVTVSGVRDMAKEGGSDKLIIEPVALIAHMAAAIKELSDRVSQLEKR